jgi:hypothetical protein
MVFAPKHRRQHGRNHEHDCTCPERNEKSVDRYGPSRYEADQLQNGNAGKYNDGNESERLHDFRLAD